MPSLGLGLGFARGVPGSSAPPALLLDSLSAGAAYSASRKLRTAYSGAAFQVERTSDGATQDIGFSGNSVDTAALLSFVGSSNGRIATWYDQSGNNRHVTNATATQRPRIVNAGVLETQNGKPSLFFDNALNSRLTNTSPFMFAAGQSTMIAVWRAAGQTTRTLFSERNSGTNNPIYRYEFGLNVTYRINLRTRDDTGAQSAFVQGVVDGEIDDTLRNYAFRDSGTQAQGFVNGLPETAQSYTRTGTFTFNLFTIGANGTAASIEAFTGYMSEAIFFPTQLSNADMNTVNLSQGGEYGISVTPFLVGEELEFFGTQADGTFRLTNTSWDGYTATMQGRETGFGGSVGYPTIFRAQQTARSGAANRVNGTVAELNVFDAYTRDFYLGMTARVYRPINGVMTLVRESTVTDAKVGRWTWQQPNGAQVLNTTAYTHRFDTWNRPNVPYWFRVAAVGSDGLAGTFTAPVTYTPTITDTAATAPTNTTRAFNKTGDGGALPAPTGFTITAGSPTRLANLSWDAVSGAEGYVVELSYYDPAVDIAANPYLDLSSHATPILANDLVILEKDALTLNDAFYTPRLFGTDAPNAGKPGMFWSQNQITKRDGNDWAYVPYSGDKPALAFGDHFLRRTAAAGQMARFQWYWFGGSGQSFYNILKVGTTYRMRVVMRASSPVNVTFNPGWTYTGTTFTSVPTTFTEYSFDLTPATIPTDTTPYDWRLEFTAGGTPINLDVAFFEIQEVGAPSGVLAKSPPATGGYLRDHSFIKPGSVNRSMRRLASNQAYGFKAFYDACVASSSKPWFQIEWNTPKSEWLDFVAYLAAPNGSHPMATVRQESGIPQPWTTTFPDIKLEMGNEAWNGLGGFWQFPSDMVDAGNATVYGNGRVAGMFWQMISNWMKESPYWSTLSPKLTQHAGGWAINAFGEDAYRHYPDAKEVSVAAYNGGWDNGTELPSESGLSFNGVLADPIVIQKPRATSRVNALKALCTSLGRNYGTDIRYTIYEAGPGYQLSGLNGASVTPEQQIVQEVVMKSRAAAASTVDAMLTYAQADFKGFNYFVTGQGDYWKSHALDIEGGQEYMTHALPRIIHENIAPARVYGAPTSALGTKTVTLQGGGTATINQIGAYQLRNIADPSKRMIVVVNRNLDPSQLDPTDPAYNATPSGSRLFNVQTTWNSAASLKVWTAGIGPYRQHNRYPVGQRRNTSGAFVSDPLCVAFNYSPTTVSVPANIKDFAINASVGATSAGLPAGNVLIMLFEGVT